MSVKLLLGDCRDVLKTLPDESVHCCITSPPYWGLRSYLPPGHPDKHREIGSEPTVHEWVQTMVDVFREVRRVLRSDGTCWINLGDSYANDGKWGGSTGGKHVKALHGDTGVGRAKRTSGFKPKDLIGQPWRVAFALQDDGWWLRQELIWAKRSPMPESVTDRFTKAHEHVFILAKSERYYFDIDAVQEVASEGTHQRLAQDVLSQKGSLRAHAGEGRGGRPMKAMAGRGLFSDQGVGRTGGHPDNPPDGERRAAHGSIESRKARASSSNKSAPTAERNGIRPSKADLATSGNDGAYAGGKSERLGRGAGWRNNGVGFGHGTDAGERSRGRVKNNASFDEAMAVMPECRNPRSVRWLASAPFKGAHYATYPPELIRPFVLAGCPPGGTVLDPFGGSGTTGLVAEREHRNAILIDLDERNLPMARERIAGDAPLFAEVA